MQTAVDHGLNDYAKTNCAEFFACLTERYFALGDVEFCKTFAPVTTELLEECLRTLGATDEEILACHGRSQEIHRIVYNGFCTPNYQWTNLYQIWSEDIVPTKIYVSRGS